MTVLAIVETVLAVAVSLWIVWYCGTITHIAVSACLAPFALMRTERSARLVWSWTQSWITLSARFPVGSFFAWLAGLVDSVGLVFGPTLLRPISVLIVFMRHPLVTLRSIPINWTATVFTIDLAHAPEALPNQMQLEAEHPQSDLARTYNFRSSMQDVARYFGGPHSGTIVIILGLPMYVIAFLPSIAYRLSVKSTALFALPVLWLVRSSLSDKPMRERVEDFKDDPIEQLVRWYGAGLLVFLGVLPVVAYVLFSKIVSVVATWSHPLVARIVTGFRLLQSGVVEVDMWHLGRLFSAAMTLVIFAYVRLALHKMRRHPEHEPSVGIFESMLLARSASTMYVMAATLFLLYSTIDWHHLPVFRLNWWPKP